MKTFFSLTIAALAACAGTLAIPVGNADLASRQAAGSCGGSVTCTPAGLCTVCGTAAGIFGGAAGRADGCLPVMVLPAV
ncbi:hypothetical protein BDV93DRAFT_519098 [Ceratobasidium sp. AG-I]|nr:hypothetical protein BDV93DRAFT_519098 [Ceratobasidium sp. AG-I]